MVPSPPRPRRRPAVPDSRDGGTWNALAGGFRWQVLRAQSLLRVCLFFFVSGRVESLGTAFRPRRPRPLPVPEPGGDPDRDPRRGSEPVVAVPWYRVKPEPDERSPDPQKTRTVDTLKYTSSPSRLRVQPQRDFMRSSRHLVPDETFRRPTATCYQNGPRGPRRSGTPSGPRLILPGTARFTVDGRQRRSRELLTRLLIDRSGAPIPAGPSPVETAAGRMTSSRDEPIGRREDVTTSSKRRVAPSVHQEGRGTGSKEFASAKGKTAVVDFPPILRTGTVLEWTPPADGASRSHGDPAQVPLR